MKDPTRRYPELSRRGEKILMALLEHSTYEKAAPAAGVSLPTLWRWRQKPEFQKAYLEARRDVHSQSMARLQQAEAAAVATVLRVMVDSYNRKSVRQGCRSSSGHSAARNGGFRYPRNCQTACRRNGSRQRGPWHRIPGSRGPAPGPGESATPQSAGKFRTGNPHEVERKRLGARRSAERNRRGNR
jgi:hypothetical protein